jgi:hypothetical protein
LTAEICLPEERCRLSFLRSCESCISVPVQTFQNHSRVIKLAEVVEAKSTRLLSKASIYEMPEQLTKL